MSNWYEAWADRYADWFPGVADVPFYVGLAREADGPLVWHRARRDPDRSGDG